MKKLFFFFSALGFLCTGAGAQNPGNPWDSYIDSTVNSHKRLNFSVPDLPAFKLLGSSLDPSQILMPSDPKAFSAIASDFYQNGRVVIPQNFALEISPLMLLREQLRKPDSVWVKWDDLRLSLGTARADSAPDTELASNVAVGLHYSLLTRNKANVRNYREALRARLQIMTDHYILQARDLSAAFRAQTGLTASKIAAMTEKELKAAIQKEQTYIDSVYNIRYRDEKMAGTEAHIREVKADFKKDNWNCARWDIALAVLGRSPGVLANLQVDSLSVADTLVRFEKAAFWTTFSLPVRTWGQFLAGGVAAVVMDSSRNPVISAGLDTRFYFGANRLKGFAEADLKIDGQTRVNSWMAVLGAEFNVYDGIWVNAYSGVQGLLKGERSNFVAHFNLRFTLPEKWGAN